MKYLMGVLYCAGKRPLASHWRSSLDRCRSAFFTASAEPGEFTHVTATFAFWNANSLVSAVDAIENENVWHHWLYRPGDDSCLLP